MPRRGRPKVDCGPAELINYIEFPGGEGQDCNGGLPNSVSGTSWHPRGASTGR